MNSSIDVIIGPMYSGKTTELIRLLNIYSEIGMKVLYVNSALDDRDGDAAFSTHNPALTVNKSRIDSVKTTNLNDIMRNCHSYDIIGIDEAQLFVGLKRFVLTMAENYGKKIIVAGLNGDFKREPFGEILGLIPVCDNVIKLYPFCQTCSQKPEKVVRVAQFTKRIGSDMETVVVIGGKMTYIPVCRECFNA